MWMGLGPGANGLATLHSGSWMSVGAMRVARVSQGVLTLYRERTCRAVFTANREILGRWGPVDTAGIWLLFCPHAEALG